MSFQVLENATIWLDEVDATCHLNEVAVPWECTVLNRTNFCSGGSKEVKGGIEDSGLEIVGFVDDEFVLDELLHRIKGASGRVGTVTVTGADGSVGYAGKRLPMKIGKPAQVGDLYGVAMSARQNTAMVRGQLLLPKQAAAGNVTGTGVQLGDIAATERLYAAVHCFVDAGTSCDVIIESDDNSGFTTPTTRSTTAVTAVGGTWVEVAPTITDTWWRVRVANVVGGSFTLAALVGIQAVPVP